jgi:hypothetical protein
MTYRLQGLVEIARQWREGCGAHFIVEEIGHKIVTTLDKSIQLASEFCHCGPHGSSLNILKREGNAPSEDQLITAATDCLYLLSSFIQAFQRLLKLPTAMKLASCTFKSLDTEGLL